MISGGIFEVDRKTSELQELQKTSNDDQFWTIPQDERTPIMKKISQLSGVLDEWKKLEETHEDLKSALDLYEECKDEELEEEIGGYARKLDSRLGHLEIINLFVGEHDEKDAIVAIHPGAGGTESADWASMLYNMYMKWANLQGFKTEILDYQAGEEAGIKSATFTVAGRHAYGHLKAEVGVHRLVRISPFDANKRRHTSFASVFVYADVDEEIEIEIRTEDLKVDTFRASGAGGQHVNTTDSAVRITHIPSGIVVSCQNERSQHKNRATAMKVLKAKLYEKEQAAQNAAKDKVNAQKQEIAWGSQIRSYVLHPYQMVKDHRTNVETGNTQAVLNGELDDFIKEALTQRVYI